MRPLPVSRVARSSTARRCSSCTTPTGSRRTSPPTCCARRVSSADMAGYEREMEAQRERARAASRFGVDLRGGPDLGTTTEFCGYDHVEGALARGGAAEGRHSRRGACSPARRAKWCWSARRSTPNRAGRSATPASSLAGGARFAVTDTRKRGAAFAHIGKLAGAALQVGDMRRRARSTARAANAPSAITPPRTCCTPRCARCWARMCSRRARWWRRTGCASTLRTSSP